MKLHLPKALLSMVLAACIAPAVWAASDNTDNSGWDKITTINNNNQTVPATNSYAIGDATIQSIDTGDSSSTDSTLFIRSNNRVSSATVENFIIAAGDTAKIDGWYDKNDTHPEFSNLTINNLTFTNADSVLYIESNNVVQVNRFNDTLNLSGYGTLKLKTDENHGAISLRNGASISITDGTYSIAKLDIHNRGTSTEDTLTISGATVKITEKEKESDVLNGGTGAAAVTIGHWHNGTGKIVVGGDAEKASVLDVSDATIRMSYDSSSVLEIKKNGTVNAKRIQFANNDDGDSAVVNLAGGRLNLGEGGVSVRDGRNKGNRELNLNSGTLGALAANVDISAGTTNIGGAITIDTAIVNAEGAQTRDKATISFSNNVVLSDDAEFTIKGGGVVNINALDINKTLQFDIQDNTKLDIGSVSLDIVYGELRSELEEINVSKCYSDNFERTQTTNGFISQNSTYRLFDGYVWEGTIDGVTTVGSQDGDTTVVLNNVGTRFYVNEDAHTISTAGDYINNRVEAFCVAKDANLVINAATRSLSAAQILTGTTGEGNITVATNITLDNGATSQATGKLTVDNATLSMGSHKSHVVNLSSFTSVDLNGATIDYHGANTELQNVTVGTTGATLSFHDMKGDNSGECDVMTLSGTTTLKGQLTVESTQWKYKLNIESLTGSGNLSVASSEDQSAPAIVQVALNNYTGAITVKKNKGAATLNATSTSPVNLEGVTLSGGATGTFVTTGNVTLGAVKLTEGDKLSIQRTDAQNEVNMSSLMLSGSSTIETVSGTNNNNSWQTKFSIGKLVGTDATLKLRSGSNTSAATVFNLNGGEGSNFSGAIEIGGYNNVAAGRKAVLNINDSTVASNSEIRFNAENGNNTSYLALGAKTVTVKGISDIKGAAQIVSGEVAVGTADVKSDSTKRTLTINTQGSNYSTAATVNANINLVKDGAGKQTFSGDVSAFNGSVTVKEGELALSAVGTGENALNLTTLDLQGGTLSLGTEGNVGEIVISKPTTGSVVANMSAKTVLNGHLSLNEGVALSLSGWGDSAAEINGKLTLGEKQFLQFSEELWNEIGKLELDSSPLLLLEYESFQLGNTEFAELSVAADAIVKATPLLGSIVDANTYFSSLNVEDYELIFTQNGLYIQVSNPIPEPTTATLSLLALAALASRRRRK